ncbi:MAG: hypothetical protein H6Q42_3395 [Deltaproteobacteria bacterium]|nr:hypothetical protein [Deltaproteobacteria bacterium]
MAVFNFWLGILWILLLLLTGIGSHSFRFAPGDPETGLWGAVCFFGAFIYVLVRRSGFFQRKHFWGELHFSLGLLGGMLVVLHSGGRFFSSAGLLTMPLMVLFLLGMNLRFFGPRQVFRPFHSKAFLFFHPARGENDLGEIIRRKETLLRNLDKNGQEGNFGLRFGDWLRSPFAAAQYLFLSRQEREKVRETCGSPPVYLDFTQGWGRYLHILVGVGAMVGVLFHLIQVCPYIPH